MKIALTPEWRERLSSPLTWHYTGFGLLLVLVVILGIRFGLDWAATNSRSASTLEGKQIQLKTLDLETQPLRGLEKKVEDSGNEIDNFYSRRIPPSYSAIAMRIGELQVKAGVRLSRVQYSQGPPGANLTEITMDAGISGDYPQIMRFVNALERDSDFFVIRAMALTGQQGGLVNLRLRVSTWLRPGAAAASGLPPTPVGQPLASVPVAGRKEGM